MWSSYRLRNPNRGIGDAEWNHLLIHPPYRQITSRLKVAQRLRDKYDQGARVRRNQTRLSRAQRRQARKNRAELKGLQKTENVRMSNG